VNRGKGRHRTLPDGATCGIKNRVVTEDLSGSKIMSAFLVLLPAESQSIAVAWASQAPPQVGKEETAVLAESQIHGRELLAGRKGVRMAFSHDSRLFGPGPWALPKAMVKLAFGQTLKLPLSYP
jgi:hypothetical protein